jgi:hypothetical protein
MLVYFTNRLKRSNALFHKVALLTKDMEMHNFLKLSGGILPTVLDGM